MSLVHSRLTLSTLLGLRFVDAGTGEVVHSDLRIEVFRPDRPGRRACARAVGSGCWVPFDLAAALGLPDVGTSERDDIGSAAWNRLVQRATQLRVEVTDLAGRFLKSRFTVPMPTPVPAPAASLADSLPVALRLYSAPWRTPAADLLALRAELLDRVSGAPLSGAWASVQLDVPAPANPPVLASGIADARGHLLLLLRQPSRTDPPPPGGAANNGAAAGAEGAARPTPLRLTLRHRAGPLGADPDWTDVAERELQATQPARQALATIAAAVADDVPLGAIRLHRGKPLVLRSMRLDLDADGQAVSRLLPSLLIAAP